MKNLPAGTGLNHAVRVTIAALSIVLGLGAAAPAAAQCPGDLTGNGQVNGADLALVLAAWASDGTDEPGSDVNQDGIVNGADLASVLGAWGNCLAGGSVRAWGWNIYGQCNIPTDLGPCTAIAGGFGHTIALRTDGTVRAWGRNDRGQCKVPTDLGTCIAVEAGNFHTIALRTDGTVRAWGWNIYGQCNIPTDLGPCTAIAGGGDYTIALRTDGTVRAWGYNAYGQCNIPADLGPCSAIAGGGSHTIALRTDGIVRAWGYNEFGQCNIPTDLGTCTAIAGGYYHTIALRTDGTVRAWGYNGFGQCNIPTDLGPCTTIGGGADHTIALRTGGTVRAWGYNVQGQCNVPTDLGPCTAIAGGNSHTIMICGATTPTWATLIEAQPDPAVVTDSELRAAISTTGLAWRVKDTATQIEMVLIPPGTFQMGCSASQTNACESWESPIHTVTLNNAFYIGRYEVTQAQWLARMGSNPSYFQSASTQVPAAQVHNRPVEQVSWDMIQGFLTQTGMRLPTEAEWEYAYRAGTTTAFHGFTGYLSGTNDDNLLGNIAWFNVNSNSQTRPVGGKLGNGYGLHDMSGNVFEWVNDWFNVNYYTESPQHSPPGPTAGFGRVVRGGGWNFPSTYCRASARYESHPTSSYFSIGFRVARTP